MSNRNSIDFDMELPERVRKRLEGGSVITPSNRISLVPYDRTFLNKSWQWLNDPEIRELTMTKRFTRDDQRNFFIQLRSRQGYLIWGVTLDGKQPVGATGLKNHRGNIAEYWGYIGEKQYWNQGLGKLLIKAVESKAIEHGFTELDLCVSKTNQRAIALYSKMGFSIRIDCPDNGRFFMIKREIGFA